MVTFLAVFRRPQAALGDQPPLKSRRQPPKGPHRLPTSSPPAFPARYPSPSRCPVNHDNKYFFSLLGSLSSHAGVQQQAQQKGYLLDSIAHHLCCYTCLLLLNHTCIVPLGFVLIAHQCYSCRYKSFSFLPSIPTLLPETETSRTIFFFTTRRKEEPLSEELVFFECFTRERRKQGPPWTAD